MNFWNTVQEAKKENRGMSTPSKGDDLTLADTEPIEESLRREHIMANSPVKHGASFGGNALRRLQTIDFKAH